MTIRVLIEHDVAYCTKYTTKSSMHFIFTNHSWDHFDLITANRMV